MSCEARRNGYDVTCARCGLAWDARDNDRPECRPVGSVGPRVLERRRVNAGPPEVERRAFRAALEKLKAHQWKERK